MLEEIQSLGSPAQIRLQLALDFRAQVGPCARSVPDRIEGEDHARIHGVHGLPIDRPGSLPVGTHEEDEALAAAAALGFPVVIKPESTDYGTAVTANIHTTAEVRTAFELARKLNPDNISVELIKFTG